MLNTDESKSWDDGILVWCNAVRTNPPVQLGINGRYLPFIVYYPYNAWPKLQSGWGFNCTFNFSEVKPLEGGGAGSI
eukprot:5258321-Ditylum_brightwellii.AAC.1